MGKAAGLPLYTLFGGAVREHVEYFYYLIVVMLPRSPRKPLRPSLRVFARCT